VHAILMRDPPSPETDARRVVRLAQDATARLRAFRRLRDRLGTRDTHADLEQWFAQRDGSCREVQLRDLSARSTQVIFDELLRRASPTATRETVWHVRRNQKICLADLPDAALLAAEGRVNLDIVLKGISHEGIALPDLVVSVWPTTLAIDFEPGTAWTDATVTGLLGLLVDVTALAGGARTLLLVDERSGPLPEPQQQRFRAALAGRARKAVDIGA
jgi:hypothetical protein